MANTKSEPVLESSPSTSVANGQDAPIDDLFAGMLGANSKIESPKALHAKMSNEPRDEAWAAHAEQELNDYLARQPYISFYESVGVECRRTLCRVQAAGNIAALASIPGTRDALANWQDMASSLRHDSAWRNFSADSMSFGRNPNHPGRVGIVMFLKRANTKE